MKYCTQVSSYDIYYCMIFLTHAENVTVCKKITITVDTIGCVIYFIIYIIYTVRGKSPERPKKFLSSRFNKDCPVSDGVFL